MRKGSLAARKRLPSAYRRALFLTCCCHYGGSEAALGVIVVPAGAQTHQFIVEVNTDTTAHAHYYRLAVQDFRPLLQVVHDVLSNLLHTVIGADDYFQLRPLGFQPLLALSLLALCASSKSGSVVGRSASSNFSLVRRLW